MDYYAPPSVLMGLPAGTAGTERTLQLMHALTMRGKTSPTVRNLAVSIVRGLPARDFSNEAKTLQEWVQNNIRYVRDVNGIETLQIPEYTLQSGAGDCDDQSILLASLLESIGQPTRFVAVAFVDDQYSHVYVQVRPGGVGPWQGAETIVRRPFGWQPPDVTAMLILDNSS